MLESRRPAAENVDLLGKVVSLGRIELVLQVSLRGPRKASDKIEEVAWDIKIAEQTSWVPLSNMHLFVLVTFIVELACGGNKDLRNREYASHVSHSGNVPNALRVGSHCRIAGDIRLPRAASSEPNKVYVQRCCVLHGIPVLAA